MDNYTQDKLAESFVDNNKESHELDGNEDNHQDNHQNLEADQKHK